MGLSTIERVLFLRGIPLFQHVAVEELVAVANVARELNFEAGEHIIRQGELGDSLYIIVAGEARVEVEGVGEVARSRPKSIIGEMAILSRKPRSASCVADTAVSALRIDYEAFWELLDEEPALARGLLLVITERLHHSLEQLRVATEAKSHHANDEGHGPRW